MPGGRSRSGRTAASSTTPGTSARPTGELPDGAGERSLQHYDSVSVLTLPGGQRHLERGLHHQQPGPRRCGRCATRPRWDAALARYPLAAHWGEGEPITGVDVDRRHRGPLPPPRRRRAARSRPASCAVGDAWACTNPSLGRGRVDRPAARAARCATCCARSARTDPRSWPARFDERPPRWRRAAVPDDPGLRPPPAGRDRRRRRRHALRDRRPAVARRQGHCSRPAVATPRSPAATSRSWRCSPRPTSCSPRRGCSTG